MITAKQAYEIAKEWMGPFALVSAGYETESHFIFLREHNRGKLWTDHASFWIDFIFLREHNRGKLWTDHASFWIDKTNGALKIVSAIPATKEYDQMQQGTQLNLEEMCE